MDADVLDSFEGPHDSMMIYNHEGSADGETTQIKNACSEILRRFSH